MRYIYSSCDSFICDININELIQSIDSNKYIYPLPGINEFIDNWKSAFYKCYIQEKDSTFFLSDNNYFMESIFVNGKEIRLHFNIDKAIKLTSLSEIQKIPLKYITCESTKKLQIASIKYTRPSFSDIQYNYCDCANPIIIANFCNGGFFYLVVDGNHRIEARKKTGFEYINAVLLPPQDTILTLQSKFEIATYLFLYEGYLLSQNDYSILKHSNSKLYM